jgi:hypothetical protein
MSWQPTFSNVRWSGGMSGKAGGGGRPERNRSRKPIFVRQQGRRASSPMCDRRPSLFSPD